VGEQTFFGPATIVEAGENVAKVGESLKIAQSRQKSNAEPKRKDVSLDVGEYVYLRVSPLQGTKRFHVKGKLSPRYVGPYLIVQRIRKTQVLYLVTCRRLAKCSKTLPNIILVPME
jgi:hypothetical protein